MHTVDLTVTLFNVAATNPSGYLYLNYFKLNIIKYSFPSVIPAICQALHSHLWPAASIPDSVDTARFVTAGSSTGWCCAGQTKYTIRVGNWEKGDKEQM